MKFYGSHLDAISCLTEERRLDLALTTWPVKYIVVNSKHLTDEKFKIQIVLSAFVNKSGIYGKWLALCCSSATFQTTRKSRQASQCNFRHVSQCLHIFAKVIEMINIEILCLLAPSYSGDKWRMRRMSQMWTHRQTHRRTFRIQWESDQSTRILNKQTFLSGILGFLSCNCRT